jgi:hypothetical protein
MPKNQDARPIQEEHHSALAGRTAPVNLQIATELPAAFRLFLLP